MVSSTIFLAAFGGLVTRSLAASSAGNPVTQISDGQIQAPASSAPNPVTQISDGQIQAPAYSTSVSSAGSPVTQISDGQIQAPASSTPSSSGASSGKFSATSGSPSSSASNLSGGYLSIAPGSTAPDASQLASRAQCEALLNYQLPPKNLVPSPPNFNFSGNVRTYYVAAEEVAWNYAPSGWDNWLGVPIQDSPHAAAAGYLNVTGSLGDKWGLEWQKAVYKGYTDESFTTPSEQPATAGINGPILRGEVNDMIQILFVNNMRNNYASMHSMGLSYGKEYDGSLYPTTVDGASPPVQEQDAVPPGGCAVYKWIISSSQAPVDGESSRLWAYHSFVNMPGDNSAGLSGPIIVYNSGEMNKTMSSNREFVVTTNTHSESGSFLAGTNARNAGINTSSMPAINKLVQPHVGNESYWVPQLANIPEIKLSAEQAPTFFDINGYVFGNGAPYEMCRNDPVIWYVMSFGQASHVFHLHGNNFISNGIYVAAQSVNAGEMMTFTMTAQLPGVWQLLCHVNSHNFYGMQQDYVIYGTEEDGEVCPLPPLTV